MGYIPLHVHTIYTPYRSLISLEELVSRARFLGFQAVGIADHWTTYPHFSFYRLAKRSGIKPIFGVELVHSSLVGKKGYFHLTVIAENNGGYKNLVKLVSVLLSKEEGRFVTTEELSRYGEGLIVLSGCNMGEAAYSVVHGRLGDARKVLERLVETFGENQVFVELMNHGLKEEFLINDQLSIIARKLGLGAVVTNNDRFIDKNDSGNLKELMRIAPDKLSMDLGGAVDEFFLKRESDLKRFFYSHEDALALSAEIADRCNVELPSDFKVYFTKGEDSDEKLNQMCRRRFILKLHGSRTNEVLRRRMEMELQHFRKNGLSGFVLSLLDLFGQAQKEGISVEIASGSVLTSFIHYLLNLIPLDPVEQGLHFDPCRAGLAPPLELIVPVNGKDDFIKLAKNIFAENCICFHITEEKMSLHTIVSRLCDSYDVEESKRGVILSEVSFHSKAKGLSEMLEASDNMSRMYAGDLLVRKIMHAAFSLRNKVLHLVMNSSKIIMMSEEFEKWVSIVEGKGAVGFANIDQYSIDSLKGWTFVLQQSHFLSAVEETIKLITVNHDKGADTKRRKKKDYFSTIDDKETFSLINSADTAGVYFLEGKGVRDLILKLNPTNFGELVNLIALYKPATLSARLWKIYLGEEADGKAPFADGSLKIEVLKNTRGVLLFDTQVKDILHHFAGIDGDDLETMMQALRGDLDVDMPTVRLNFIKASLEHGASEKSAQEVFDYLVESLRYVQDKASILMQAFLSYRTAYLKAHHLIPYFAALLNSYSGVKERQAIYLNYLSSKDIKVKVPDVNLSCEKYLPEEDGLRAPLTIVKRLDRDDISAILEERDAGGAYRSFEDFMNRIGRKMNMDSIDSLIDSGAFDWLKESRKVLKKNAREVALEVEKEKERSAEEMKRQLSLFDEESST